MKRLIMAYAKWRIRRSLVAKQERPTRLIGRW